MTLFVVVYEESPKENFLILPSAQTTSVDVCAHLDGHLEFDAAVAEESEEQPRVVLWESTFLVKLPATYAAIP